MKCATGHVWEDCTCPADVVDDQQTRRTFTGIFIAVAVAILLAFMFDCVDSELVGL